MDYYNMQQNDERFFPLLPFLFGAALSPYLYGYPYYGYSHYPYYGPYYGYNYSPYYYGYY